MASNLTQEQRARIELNRKLALEKRAARLAQVSQQNSSLNSSIARNNLNVSDSKLSSQERDVEKINNLASLSNKFNVNSSKPSCNALITSIPRTVSTTKSSTCTTNAKYVNTSSFYQNLSSSSTTPNPNYSLLDLKFIKSNSADSSNSYQKTNGSNTAIATKVTKSLTCSAFNTQVKVQNPVIGVCKLISKERFTVDIPYQQQAIDLFRTIKEKEYDSNTKQWTFPLTEFFNFKKTLSVLRPHVVIGDLPKCVVETFITKAKTFQQDISKVDISRVDKKLKQTIYPFQKEGIQYGVSKGGRCLIADDMGLGKSIQALGVADYYRSDWPLLIVCPSSMRFQWEEEIRVNLPSSVHTHQVFVMTSGKDIVEDAKVLIMSYDLLAKKKDLIKDMGFGVAIMWEEEIRVNLPSSVHTLQVFVMTSGKDIVEDAKVLIMSYDLLAKKKDLIKDMGFGVAIMDECHSIKSIKSQRGKAALEVAQQCRRVILLSGTPVLSRPAELYTQLKALDPSAFPYFKEYGMRYCNGNQTKFGWDFNGSSNMEELKLLLDARFMIRRLKSSVLTQLPSKIRQVIVLNSQALIKNNDSMDAFALKLQSSSLKGSERHGTLLSYFSETAKTKAAAVCEYIKDLLQDNRKFLCFAHHAEMLDAVSNTLENSNTYYIRIDGSVSAEDRKVLCDKFQYEDKWKVAVLSIKAANTGLTLTAAQVVIFAELFWNPGDLAQAEDRVHRIGQEDCVVVKYLIAKGTADDYLWPLIQSKLEVLNKAGLSKESYIVADTKHAKVPDNTKESQRKMYDFFKNPFSDEDNEDLLKVMDEVDGVQEKKIKLDI